MAESTPATPRRRELTLDQYYQGVIEGEIHVLARALTLIESRNPQQQKMAEQLLTRLLPHTGGAIRVGITGAPGVGKSTFIEALGLHLIEQGKRVAVLAVDPSSGLSGGSILGDKTRMTKLSAESAAYIRPSPSSGTLGGVARRTRESVLACEAAGFDVLLVETVGVGQSETLVADMTDCFLALMLPGAGDELQGIKRGLLELVDVLAVNKADGETRLAAERAARQYEVAFRSLSGRSSQAEEAPEVVTCSALHGEGVDAVWLAVQRRYVRQRENGALQRRRGRQNWHWLWHLVEQRVQQAIRKHAKTYDGRVALERDVIAGVVLPEVAARQILESFGLNGSNQYEHQ